MYGIEVWQLFPQVGPFWWRDQVSGELEIFADYDDAYIRKNELYQDSDLRNFSFRVVEYLECDEAT